MSAESKVPLGVVAGYEYDNEGRISKVSSPMYENGEIIGIIQYDISTNMKMVIYQKLKKMYEMKKIGILSAVLLFSLYTTVYASDLTKAVQGVWTAKVADAPYGYQDYQVTIKQVEGKCLADITGSQLNVKNQELKEVNGKLTTTVYAGENVNVVIWKEKKDVKGTADTSMGKLPIEFTRLKKAK